MVEVSIVTGDRCHLVQLCGDRCHCARCPSGDKCHPSGGCVVAGHTGHTVECPWGHWCHRALMALLVPSCCQGTHRGTGGTHGCVGTGATCRGVLLTVDGHATSEAPGTWPGPSVTSPGGHLAKTRVPKALARTRLGGHGPGDGSVTWMAVSPRWQRPCRWPGDGRVISGGFKPGPSSCHRRWQGTGLSPPKGSAGA